MRTTSILLKGDEFKAKQLSLAHTERLLAEFRKQNEFQDLKVNTLNKNFFNDTGEFIGNITIQSIHGVETVVSSVPIEKPKPKKKKKILKKEPGFLIVPLIRSVDNKYWIACLSGTFDGPYYCFRNNLDISEESLDDNLENELDGQLISVGDYSLNNSTNLPSLFFIAQTGSRPEYDDVEYDYSGGQTIEIIGKGNIIDISLCLHDPYDIDYYCEGSKTVTIYENYYNCTLMDERYGSITGSPFVTTISVYDKFVTPKGIEEWAAYNLTTSGVVRYAGDSAYELDHRPIPHDCVFINEVVPQYIASVRDDITAFLINNYNNEDDLYYDDSVKYNLSSSLSTDSYELFAAHESVRIEVNNTDKFCSGYRHTNTIKNATAFQDFLTCTLIDGQPELETTSDEVTLYTDYIMVDSNAYEVYGATAEKYPQSYIGPNMFKYYGTDSIAETSMLGCIARNNSSNKIEEYKYVYHGPNSPTEDVHPTVFIPESVSSINIGHIIPNVPGIDDSIKFNGKIFLGMIQYEIEKEFYVEE